MTGRKLALLLAPALAVWGALPVGACTANLSELDECGDLADALCERLDRCGGGIARGRCRAELGAHCADTDAVKISDPDACAVDLADGCGERMPASCAPLGESLGCGACGSEAPDEDLVAACCAVDGFSAVCARCYP